MLNNIFTVITLFALDSTFSFSHTDDNLKIINGNLVPDTTETIYQVSIQVKTAEIQETRGHICGGALISKQHVLTAATCFLREGTDGNLEQIEIELFQALVGSTDLQNSTLGPINGEKITIHPDFNLLTLENDIAILKLADEVSLPAQAIEMGHNDDLTEASCSVSGWGSTLTSPITDQIVKELLITEVKVDDQNVCEAKLENLNLPEGVDLSGILCTYGANNMEDGIGLYGDVGDPLACGDTLAGIAMMRFDNLNLTGVYVRVHYHETWIEEIISDARTVLPPAFILISVAMLQLYSLSLF